MPTFQTNQVCLRSSLCQILHVSCESNSVPSVPSKPLENLKKVNPVINPTSSISQPIQKPPEKKPANKFNDEMNFDLDEMDFRKPAAGQDSQAGNNLGTNKLDPTKPNLFGNSKPDPIGKAPLAPLDRKVLGNYGNPSNLDSSGLNQVPVKPASKLPKQDDDWPIDDDDDLLKDDHDLEDYGQAEDKPETPPVKPATTKPMIIPTTKPTIIPTPKPTILPTPKPLDTSNL